MIPNSKILPSYEEIKGFYYGEVSSYTDEKTDSTDAGEMIEAIRKLVIEYININTDKASNLTPEPTE